MGKQRREDENRTVPPRRHDPAYLRMRSLVARVDQSDPDPITAQANCLLVDLFERINEQGDVARDRSASDAVRLRALKALEQARRKVTPRGRPQKVDHIDVALEWAVLERVCEQFQAVMKECQAGQSAGVETAAEAVRYIKEARRGEIDASAAVKSFAPDFLNPEVIPGLETERLLRLLSDIKRPGRNLLEAIASRIIMARHDVPRSFAVSLLRLIRDARPATPDPIGRPTRPPSADQNPADVDPNKLVAVPLDAELAAALGDLGIATDVVPPTHSPSPANTSAVRSAAGSAQADSTDDVCAATNSSAVQPTTQSPGGDEAGTMM